MYSAQFISEAISKDICARLAREVVSLVPQVMDYTCTICEYPPPVRHQCIPWTACRHRLSLLFSGRKLWAYTWLGLSLCWLPIRLDCDHLFCIRCMIKMQNQNKRYCPLCRADVVQNANESKRCYIQVSFQTRLTGSHPSPHR